jgi:putative Mn2+ efflux pump MntP
MELTTTRPWVQNMARAGFIAKGIVYLLLGALAFMAAFEIRNTSSKDTGKGSIFGSIKDWPAGSWLLGILAAGLVCYGLWRLVQAFSNTGKEIKWIKRIGYFFSGLTYLALAFSAAQILLSSGGSSSGDQNQHWAGEILSKSYGQVLLGIGALLIAGIGIYQIYYGLSEKYKKHIEQSGSQSEAKRMLIGFGKVGYVARGLVWLITAYLLMNAARHASASEAGDTTKAFQFVEGSFGSILLGALAVGLMLYGAFNFIRAQHERF